MPNAWTEGMQKMPSEKLQHSALSMAHSTTVDMTTLVEALLQSSSGEGILPPKVMDEFLVPEYRVNEFLPGQV
jgi:hypothetical protein